VAMTFTLAAVFVPVVFLEGRTGRLFTEFALTLAGAVLISGFVALTLSPMMSGRLLRHNPQENWLSRQIGRGLDALDRAYRRLLSLALATRMPVVLLLLFTTGAAAFVYTRLPAELAPTEDQGVLVGIAIAPEGATVDYTDAYMRQVEALYAKVPEIDRAFVATGIPVASQGLSFVLLKPWEERQRNSRMVAGALAPGMFGIPGVIAFPITLPPLGANPLEKPVTFVVRDSRPYAEIGRTVDQLLAEVAKNPGFRNVETDLKINTPQLNVTVDRDLIGDFGIDVAAVGRTIETMLGGRDVTKFKRDGKQYDVIVQMEEGERATPEDMNRIFVRTAAGEPVPLSSVATIGEIVGPRDLNHFNRARAVKITANLAEGYSLGEALAFLEQAASRLLPPTASFAYDGQSLEFKESGSALVLAFLLALVFIYLVLAAQFESFVDPLIILVTVPLSLAGALLALQLTGNTINIYSQIGLITLVGLITKHGILITEFANQQQEGGVSKLDAVVAAAALRLRPILMTTAAMVLGAVPLAIADGAGAESRHQIGWVIIGGLSLGTILTLFVVPVAYSFLARDRKRRPTVDYDAIEAAPAE
jgi:multidrug efflux pump